jgi:hypothetical protein
LEGFDTDEGRPKRVGPPNLLPPVPAPPVLRTTQHEGCIKIATLLNAPQDMAPDPLINAVELSSCSNQGGADDYDKQVRVATFWPRPGSL